MVYDKIMYALSRDNDVCVHTKFLTSVDAVFFSILIHSVFTVVAREGLRGTAGCVIHRLCMKEALMGTCSENYLTKGQDVILFLFPPKRYK